MRLLFALSLFVSAFFLFLVQPMVGKMVLPLLGGSPAVWNTCMVFFQAVLLLGYLYAHRLTRVSSQPRQLAIHFAVLAVAAGSLIVWLSRTPEYTALPVFASLAAADSVPPVLNLLAVLTVAVGLPFFALSSSAPLLQKWFTATGHPSAKDPYFLYTASNAGSLLALLGYPLLVEPRFQLVEQTWVFAAGFALLFALTALCGRATLRPLRPPSMMPPGPVIGSQPPPTRFDKLWWVALAFVPSSLMLGVTTHLTTDIAAVPLLWVLPLSLYLLTYIVAFARGSERLRGPLGSITPVVILLLTFVVTSDLWMSVGLQVLAHCGAFFVIALTLHTQLAHARPHHAHLTNFYLWVSVGGVLGGVFNALIAPLLFPLPFEYGAAVALACFLLRRDGGGKDQPSARGRLWVDALVAFVTVLVCIGLRVADGSGAVELVSRWTAARLNSLLQFSGLTAAADAKVLAILFAFGLPCLFAFVFIDRPLRFAVVVLAVFFVHYYLGANNAGVRATTRTYFGVLLVGEGAREVPGLEEKPKLRVLLHGTTLHGSQFLPTDELERAYPGLSREPLMYYHRTGPVGDLYRDTFRRHPDARTATVGLGAGATAAYVGNGQSITFYEIDPKVLELVEPPEHFTFLHDARERGAAVETVLGDARLTLARHDGPPYHLLLLDAFSSDSIPLHLITLEAVRLYADRISPEGLIGVHISNRYLDLAPVVAAAARECGLVCRVRTDKCEDDNLMTLPGTPPGKSSSSWVVLAKSEAALAAFDAAATPAELVIGGGALAARPPRWERVEVPDSFRVWTDDYADVLAVMKSPEVRWLRRQLGLPSYAR